MTLKQLMTIKKEARQSVLKHLKRYDYTLEDIKNDKMIICDIVLININDIDVEDLESFESKTSIIYRDRNILVFDGLLD